MNLKIANRLKQARETAGISRKDMASTICVARTTLGGWETGRHSPKLGDLQKYAATCNVTVAWIVGEVDDMSWSPTTTGATPVTLRNLEEVA